LYRFIRFLSQKLCICIALNDTVLGIAAQRCLKVVFLKQFLIYTKSADRVLCAVFVRRKRMYLQVWFRISQIRKSQKRSGPQIANPQSATFAEGAQI
jgi:hypothetical protein